MAEKGRSDTLRISPVDQQGRKIDPIVLAAAHEIGRRALQYGEQALHDPALATSLLEESAATVSRAMRAREQTAAAPIQNLHGYLFRAFVRRVNRVKRKELILQNSTTVISESYPNGVHTPREVELKVLVDELLARCDQAIRDMFHRRVSGFSWQEIGTAYGITGHAAESRFSRAFQRARKRLGLEIRVGPNAKP